MGGLGLGSPQILPSLIGIILILFVVLFVDQWFGGSLPYKDGFRIGFQLVSLLTARP